MPKDTIKRLVTCLIGAVLAGVCLQAPIAVLADVNLPDYALIIKAWKEILLGVAGLLLVVELGKSGRWREFLYDKLLYLCLAVAVINLGLMLTIPNNQMSEYAALLVNLRIYFIFSIFYILVKIYPAAKQVLLKFVGVGMAVVCIFSLLQVMVLPKDILVNIGYSKETIRPYLTVDEHDDFVRINSTLRGPNPLGAFAVIVLSLLAAIWANGYKPKGRKLILAWLLGIGALTALWFSYSRSAWLAALVAAGILAAIYHRRYWRIEMGRLATGVLICLATVLAGVGFYFASQSDAVKTVIFHNNPASENTIKSDDQHAESLIEGVNHTIEAPLGNGLGSVGSPSLLGEAPRIVENQYFYITAETGVIGLVVQLAIIIMLFCGLWKGRQHALSAGVLASGVGMMVVGLVLPVWADDTVGLVWWALAGVALGYNYNQTIKLERKDYARKNDQKAA